MMSTKSSAIRAPIAIRSAGAMNVMVRPMTWLIGDVAARARKPTSLGVTMALQLAGNRVIVTYRQHLIAVAWELRTDDA